MKHMRPINFPALASLAVAVHLLACDAPGLGDERQHTGLSVEPAEVDAWPGRAVRFEAVGSAGETGVTWSVQEAGGGTVDTTGLYVAPSAFGTFHVVATSTANPAISGAAAVTVVDPSVAIIPSSRRTTWDPGIPGGIPDSSAFTVHTTLPAGSTAAAINSAIQAAGAVATAASPRVVQLEAGVYNLNDNIDLNRDYVVLRGAGPDPDGNGSGTRLVRTSGGIGMAMGGGVDWGPARNVVGDIPKGASSFTLAAGHGVQVGDLITLDMLDDSTVVRGDGNWWKRAPGNSDNGPASPGGYRSIGQVVEVTGVTGDVITIAGIVHHAMPASRSPQVFGNSSRRKGWIGIGLEALTLTGVDNDYGISIWNTRRCWLKRVELDGRPTAQGGFGEGSQGTDIRMFRSVRNVLESNYFHHSRNYQTNNNAYSVSIAMQSSDNLVWDNIIWFKNKNLVMEASGPGNVIAYNFIEDPVIDDNADGVPQTGWMEMGLDATHLSYPMFDLFEGNYTSKMGGAVTHGASASQTFYRNYSRGDRIYTMSNNAALASVLFAEAMYDMNVIGNVLDTRAGGIWQPAVNPTTHMLANPGDLSKPKIWNLGAPDGEWGGPFDLQVDATLMRFANWDGIRQIIDTDPAAELPDSLFLSAAPPWWGGAPWPPVDPFGATAGARVGTLPAKARFDAGTYIE